MTNPKHLPECFNGRQRSGGLPCICDRLRACEQRVLDAARDAVWWSQDESMPDAALAAIDALRRESDV